MSDELTTMIWAVGIIVVIGGSLWYIFRDDKGVDPNKDGKADIKDVSVAVDRVIVEVDKALNKVVTEVKKRAPAKKAAAKKAPAAKKPRAPRKKNDG
jgi:hypothetical protein